MNLIIRKSLITSKIDSIFFEYQIFFSRKSIVYTKRRTRAVAARTTKIESEPIHMTRRATRNQKPIKEIETNKRQTRKRKQSTTDDGSNNTVALRKKKAVPPPPKKTNTRKTRVKKTKGLV